LADTFSFPHRIKKWWKIMFIEMLQFCIVNSFIIYTKELGKNMTIKQFTLEIFKFLAAPQIERIQQNLRSNPGNLQFPVKVNGNWPKKCKQCKAHKSSYRCQLCSDEKGKDITLCILNNECFKEFHENSSNFK